jgi:hypothetical protein
MVFTTWLWGRPEFVHLGRLGGPGGQKTPSKRWGASCLIFRTGETGRQGRPDSKNQRFPVPKPCIEKPSVRLADASSLCNRRCPGATCPCPLPERGCRMLPPEILRIRLCLVALELRIQKYNSCFGRFGTVSGRNWPGTRSNGSGSTHVIKTHLKANP